MVGIKTISSSWTDAWMVSSVVFSCAGVMGASRLPMRSERRNFVLLFMTVKLMKPLQYVQEWDSWPRLNLMSIGTETVSI